ncbi:Cgr1-domain-containing protein [Terfezia boudieri ATCC MYA-4762]|uniref:rRNA-processing protein n=1 Tax=Terfezia boudieri ATCC MYA-4762 TaxID=1051890 RepID=A0A3N4LPF3_9PEZI|nr:Cgr1-domain-containing protein [Terfezia boudieri ATCC MYA-4762]
MAEPVTTTTSPTVTTSSSTATATTTTVPAAAKKGLRVNGKNWKPQKTAFRPQLGHKTTWEARSKARKHQELVKAKEKELRDEKEAVRQKHITTLKEKREKAAEKARYAALAEKMHKKRVERLKRREKRNKALKER